MRRLILMVALAACVAMCASSFAAGIQVSSGAADYQVFQRGADNRADVKIAGTAENADSKRVEARVTGAKGAVAGLKWHGAGTVVNGKWSAEIKGVPTGGPYTIEIRVTGTAGVAAVKDVLVGVSLQGLASGAGHQFAEDREVEVAVEHLPAGGLLGLNHG